MKPKRAQPKAAKPIAKPAAMRKTAPPPRTRLGARADFGAPVDGFFAKQPPELRALLEELRGLVEEAAPDATSSIKWGMPFYSVGDKMMCALAGHKSHVNLILAGPPGTFDDPEERLEGDGKTGKQLKLRAGDHIPRAAVRGWLETAATRARQ